MRVAVIGGGATGLCVAKELREQGHEPHVFEAESSIGGVYRRAPTSTRLTTSSHNTAFGSDPVEESVMWSCNEYVEYLEAYFQRHTLGDCLSFSSRVLDAKFTAGQGWEVSVQTGGTVS